jgi:hypothetical protein
LYAKDTHSTRLVPREREKKLQDKRLAVRAEKAVRGTVTEKTTDCESRKGHYATALVNPKAQEHDVRPRRDKHDVDK